MPVFGMFLHGIFLALLIPITLCISECTPWATSDGARPTGDRQLVNDTTLSNNVLYGIKQHEDKMRRQDNRQLGGREGELSLQSPGPSDQIDDVIWVYVGTFFEREHAFYRYTNSIEDFRCGLVVHYCLCGPKSENNTICD